MTLKTTLQIINSLIDGDESSTYLQCKYNLSRSSFARHIKEARHMGAALKSYKTEEGFFWRLQNPQAVERTVRIWLELEITRSLTDQPDLFQQDQSKNA